MPAIVLCALRAANTGRETVVATSRDSANDLVAHAAEKAGIRVFRGDENDVLGRFTFAVQDLPDEAIVVRLTADNLFPDGQFVDELVAAFSSQSADYLAPHFPDDGLPYGMMAEITTAGALRISARESSLPGDREHVTQWVRRKGKVAIFRADGLNENWAGTRATIDNLDDYELVAGIFASEDQPVRVPWRSLCDRLAPLAPRELPGLVLGMANLCIPNYGRRKRSFLPEQNLALIKSAIRRGIRSFECAPAYGQAEEMAGQINHNSASTVEFTTKLALLRDLDAGSTAKEIETATESSVWQSCAKMNLSRIPILLLHRCELLHLAGGAAWKRLLQLQKQGVIGELGVSIYTPEEASTALETPGLQHLQLPVNVLDRRWTFSKTSRLIQERNICATARSVFLQGILISGPEFWPSISEVSPSSILARLDGIADEFKRKNRLDLCLAYVRSLPWIRKIVVGAESQAQLNEIADLYAVPPLTPEQSARLEFLFSGLPTELLDPRTWPAP